MQKSNIKSVTPRQEGKAIKPNLTSEQYQALTKMYSITKMNSKNGDGRQRQQHQVTPRNNTPQSCRTAQEMKYFLYQKSITKDTNKQQTNSQVFPKTTTSIHRNFSQLEKSTCTLVLSTGQATTPQSSKKKYNLLSADSRFSSHTFAQHIASQLKQKDEPNKKQNLHVSLDDFVTQVNRPAQNFVSPFSQAKSLSPSSRVNSSKQQKKLYYITQLIESYKHQIPKTPEQQLFRDHAVQTYNCIGFCINLKEPDPQYLQLKCLNLPMKPHYKYRKTVVFDLDETLIHCNENQSLKADVYLPITFPSGDTVQAGINIRPYAKWILQELSNLCEVIVFTASHECYASQVIQYLDPEGTLLAAQLFRDRCMLSPDGVHIKDLRVINRDSKDIVLVDNAAYSFGMHLENGIPIIPYYDNKEDKELKILFEFLTEQVLPAPDCRLVLQSTFRLREFVKFNEPKSAVEKLF